MPSAVLSSDVDKLMERIRLGMTSNSSFKLAGFEKLSHDSGVVMKKLESLGKRSMPSQPKVAPPAEPEAAISSCNTKQETPSSIHGLLSKQAISSSREVLQNFISGNESPISDSSFESTSGGDEYVQNIMSNAGAARPSTSNDTPNGSIDNILVDLVEQVHQVKNEYKSIHQKMDDNESERRDLVKCLTTSVHMLANNQTGGSNTLVKFLNEVRHEMNEIRRDQHNTNEVMAAVVELLSTVTNRQVEPKHGIIDDEMISAPEPIEKGNGLFSLFVNFV